MTEACRVEGPITEFQKEVAGEVHKDYFEKNWNDWKWHLKYSIRNLSTVEKLLGIKYEPELRQKLPSTIEEADESGYGGVASLPADHDDAVALIPDETERLERRNNSSGQET